MEHSFWSMTSGTWINAAGVLAGAAVGAGFRAQINATMQRTVQQSVGLVVLVIGAQIALRLGEVRVGPLDGVILALVALGVGAVVGEGLRVEERLAQLGAAVTRGGEGDRFSAAVVTPFLLFCIGPLTLLGSLANGLTGDISLLLLKTTLDTIAALALACSFGILVGLTVIPLLLLQVGLSLGAGLLGAAAGDIAQSPAFVLALGVGGVLLLGLALNLLELTRVRVAALLPALIVAPASYLVLAGLLAA